MIDITSKYFKLSFFWILVVMFFFTASFLILYSFGFTFSLSRGIFVHAGSITLKANPQDIEVEMNGLNISGKLNRLNSSYLIGRVSPDEYVLKISAPAFSTWSKKVSVHSGHSTEFWNVLLVRNNYERTTYDSDNVSNFFISPSENLIAGIRNINGMFSVFILDTNTNISSEIFSSNEYTFTDNKQENIEWSPQSKSIIIPLKTGTENEYLSYNIESRRITSITDLSKSKDISSVRWDTEEKNIVYFMSENNLYRMNMDDNSAKITIAEKISSYDISGRFIYYFQLSDGLVYQTRSDGSSKPLQITTLPPLEMDDPAYKIIVYDKEKVVMRNSSGKLYIFNETSKKEHFRKLGDNIQGTQFSNDGKKLLFWDNREIFAYFTTDWETQPRRNENDVISITRYSQQVNNVHWNNDYEHVIFSIDKEIKITELDDRDNRNTFNITSISMNDSKVVNNFSDNRIYFIDNSENSIPVIQSIQFPEKTGILGF